MIDGVPIRGIVIGRQGLDTALVQIASETEVAALAEAHAAVAVTPVLAPRQPPDIDLMNALLGGEVYARMPDGSFRPFGMIRDVRIKYDQLDVTSFSDTEPRFIRGLGRLVFSGEGPASV